MRFESGSMMLAKDRQRLERDLPDAIGDCEIEIAFQPQYALPGDTLIGAEALARWRHPILGCVDAASLVAAADQGEQATRLTCYVMHRALDEAARWPQDMRLSLNVTPRDLQEPYFAENFEDMLMRSGFEARRLTLELTENALLDDVDHAARILAKLRGIGVRIALDDFGAGFCNFDYLKRLPLDYLKLDRSMAVGLSEDDRSVAILRGIVTMARALDLTVVAEGIETESQRRVVEEERCAAYQGFYRSRAVSGQAFRDLVA